MQNSNLSTLYPYYKFQSIWEIRLGRALTLWHTQLVMEKFVSNWKSDLNGQCSYSKLYGHHLNAWLPTDGDRKG